MQFNIHPIKVDIKVHFDHAKYTLIKQSELCVRKVENYILFAFFYFVQAKFTLFEQSQLCSKVHFVYNRYICILKNPIWIALNQIKTVTCYIQLRHNITHIQHK